VKIARGTVKITQGTVKITQGTAKIEQRFECSSANYKICWYSKKRWI